MAWHFSSISQSASTRQITHRPSLHSPTERLNTGMGFGTVVALSPPHLKQSNHEATIIYLKPHFSLDKMVILTRRFQKAISLLPAVSLVLSEEKRKKGRVVRTDFLQNDEKRRAWNNGSSFLIIFKMAVRKKELPVARLQRSDRAGVGFPLSSDLLQFCST